jgi:hypothetical protein
MASAECFFLKGRSTEFAIPTMEVFESDFNIVFINERKAFSYWEKVSISSMTRTLWMLGLFLSTFAILLANSSSSISDRLGLDFNS